MRRYRSLLFYVAAVLVLSLAYFASPVSKETIWQLFPGLQAMAQAHPFVTALMFLATSTVLAFLAFPCMPMIYMASGFYMDGFAGGCNCVAGRCSWRLERVFILPQTQSTFSCCSFDSTLCFENLVHFARVRLSPLVPAPLVNFFAAVCHISPLQYLTTTVLGSAPLVLFYVQIGQQGHQFLSGETTQWRQFSGYLVILIFSTLLCAMGPWRSVLNKLKQLKSSSGTKGIPAIAGI